jgi:hypothetical protein
MYDSGIKDEITAMYLLMNDPAMIKNVDSGIFYGMSHKKKSEWEIFPPALFLRYLGISRIAGPTRLCVGFIAQIV